MNINLESLYQLFCSYCDLEIHMTNEFSKMKAESCSICDQRNQMTTKFLTKSESNAWESWLQLFVTWSYNLSKRFEMFWALDTQYHCIFEKPYHAAF